MDGVTLNYQIGTSAKVWAVNGTYNQFTNDFVFASSEGLIGSFGVSAFLFSLF